MALSKKEYKTLESIVGGEHISADPVILDSYCFNWLVEFQPEVSPDKFMKDRPAAAILPGSVEEVQAIVRAANRHGFKYKAISTGYGGHSMAGQENVVLIDLRRMDRIIEIDEKNKFAVVEPYVAWCQLVPEAMKRGLHTTPVQAGSQASVLANVTSGWGMNTMGYHGGHNGKNCLGVEWVTPDGELLRMGHPSEWFSGDGPGPSLRGVMRGHCGAQGGMGVFTKVGIKLHSWPGPRALETEPSDPLLVYRLKEPPENCECSPISFDTYEDMAECIYRLGDAEVGYAIVRAGGPEHMAMMAGGASNEMLYMMHKMGVVDEIGKLFKHPLVVVIWSNTKREFEYEMKVLEEIVAETNGVIPDLPKDPNSPLGLLGSQSFPIAIFGNDTHFIHHAGGFVINAGYLGTSDSVMKHMGEPAERLKEKYAKQNVILPDGLDSTYNNIFENNAFNYTEMEFHYDAADPKQVLFSMKLVAEERDTLEEEKLGFEPNDIGLTVGDSEMSNMRRIAWMGPRFHNFHIWQDRIKNAFDPNDASDRSNYGAGIAGDELMRKHMKEMEGS